MATSNVVDIDGDTHELWTQDQAMGCGPSCLAMIARKHGKSCGEDWISGLISSSERQLTVTGMSGGHDFSKVGTFNVQAALRYLNITSTYTDKTGNYQRAFKRCKKSKPGMAWIQWRRWTQPGGAGTAVQWHDDPAGGTHWICILGTSSTNPGQYIVLDPAAGHGVSAQSYAALPYYTAPNGSQGKFRTYNENGVITTA